MKKIILAAMLLLPIVSNGAIVIQPTPLNTAVKPPMTVTIDGVNQLNGINALVANNRALVQLGKALFWDSNVGSDGMACASCHFASGTDSRVVNQINSGYNHNNSRIYNALPGGTVGPNQTLKAADFPLWQFTGTDPANPARMTATVVDDVVSSSGTQNGTFVNLNMLRRTENCTSRVMDEANVSGLNVRRVEPRNTPSTIDSTFYVRNFWDGRANKVFNGVNPFGLRDPNARIWINTGIPTPVKIVIDNASLASQAVGPVLSDLEMSCAGRTFNTVGTKLVGKRILENQTINMNDSVLSLVAFKPTYRTLIRQAFQSTLWTGSNDTNIPLDEANFPLFFGLAVQAYEDTLRSDRTRYDLFPRTMQEIIPAGETLPIAIAPQLVRTANGTFQGMTASESRGLDIFMGTVSQLNPSIGIDPATNLPIPAKDGRCIGCHSGPEFSSATFTALAKAPNGVTLLNPGAVVAEPPAEPMSFAPGGPVVAEINGVPVFDPTLQFGTYDLGFYDVGVTPLAYDVGLGGTDPWGNPLSFAQQWKNAFNLQPCPVNVPADGAASCSPPATVDEFKVNINFVDVNGNPVIMTPDMAPPRVAGSFKTPSLRNLSLTAPYFHNGSAKSIQESLVVYNNGGLFINPNLHPDVKPLGLDVTDFTDLTNFMLTLTDNRVAMEAAPFDHPSLIIPNGHQVVQKPGTTDAVDNFITLPATGRNGRPAPATFEAQLK